MESHHVVPDVLDHVPHEHLHVHYGDHKVEMGNELSPTAVKQAPHHVKWEAHKDKFYTLVMVDPDSPSKETPTNREFLHWMVVNIPGHEIEKGEVVAAYAGAGPCQGSHLHRYVFVVYEQPGKLDCSDEQKCEHNCCKNRPQRNIRQFAEKHHLTAIAGNFFQAQYDPEVPCVPGEHGPHPQ